MPKHWDYSQAPGSTVGLMVCTACHKKITQGQYRFRETDLAYLPQHRSCSSSDPMWELLDKKESLRSHFEDRKLAAFLLFKAEFGEPPYLTEED